MGHTYLMGLLLAVHGTCARASTCTAIQDITEGGTAILTCHFDVDLYSTQTNVNIKQYRHVTGNVVDRSPFSEKDWISCSWMSPVSGMLCNPSNFRPLGAINQTVSFAVAKITRDTPDAYSCHTVPPTGNTAQRCSITVLGMPAITTSPSVMFYGETETESQVKEGIKGEAAELSSNEMDHDHERWFSAPLYGFIVIGLLGALLIVAIVIAAAVIVHTWRSKSVDRQYQPLPREINTKDH